MKKEILICLLTCVCSLIAVSIVEAFARTADLLWATWIVLLLLTLLFCVLFCIQMYKEKKDSRTNELKIRNEGLNASVKSLQKKLDETRLKADIYDKGAERFRMFYRYAVLPWIGKQVEDNEISTKSYEEWAQEFNEFFKQF